MIIVTGATGFLGTAVCQQLDAHRIVYLELGGRAHIDLRDGADFDAFLADYQVSALVHLAYPGTDGIGTSVDTPATLAHDVLRIDMNVIRACAVQRIPKLITIGSVCSYPEQVTFPTDESQLFAGPPEAVNAPYGHAKRMQLALLDAYYRQYNLQYSQLILANLYGPGDTSGHVIPATIRKVLDAQRDAAPSIEVWGDGTATREFLYVEDAADAVLKALDAPALNQGVNICSGLETPIRTLVEGVIARVGYAGSVRWDPSKPNGQPRRWFSHARATQLLGWHPQTSFANGLSATVAALSQP